MPVPIGANAATDAAALVNAAARSMVLYLASKVESSVHRMREACCRKGRERRQGGLEVGEEGGGHHR